MFLLIFFQDFSDLITLSGVHLICAGSTTDYNLVAPIRQTASIFKQPVTLYKDHKSKVRVGRQTVMNHTKSPQSRRSCRMSSEPHWTTSFTNFSLKALLFTFYSFFNPKTCNGVPYFLISITKVTINIQIENQRY